MSAKIKGVLSPLKPTKQRLITFVLWFIYGIIADILFEALVKFTSGDAGTWGRLEVGFPFYVGHDTTSIAYDDLILLAVTLFFIFTRKVWKGLGFFFGWYVSSCQDFYSRLGLTKVTTGE